MKSTHLRPATSIVLLSAGFLFAASVSGRAALVTLPSASLSPPIVDPGIIVNFGEVTLGTPIQNQTIKGFTFSENIPTASTSDQGPHQFVPGPLNLSGISLQSVLGADLTNYVLTVTMPIPVHSFGFGYAINNFDSVPSAVSITVFNGSTNLGSITYPGAPDPTFTGGFAGIGSTDYFTSAQIRFPTASLFAIDNLTVPEPSSLGLMLLGCAALASQRRRQTARN